jgi:hypothetical protein
MKAHLMIVLVAVACGCGGGGSSAPAPRNSGPEIPAPPPAPAAEPYALAVVYEGWELWIGNDKNPKVPADDPTVRPGLLDNLIAGVAEADLPHTAPPDALAMLITYSNKPVIRLPMGPARALTPDRFGSQVDYYGHNGVELVEALWLATQELAKVERPKKYLLVISDGTDTDPEGARREVARLRDELAKDHVKVFSFIYKARDSLEGDVLAPLQPGMKFAKAKSLVRELTAVLREL